MGPACPPGARACWFAENHRALNKSTDSPRYSPEAKTWRAGFLLIVKQKVAGKPQSVHGITQERHLCM
jgi:hypothetical protein